MKKLKFAKKKKEKKSTLKRKADILLSKFIRKLNHCERDGETKNLQVAHVYSRRFVNLRYDIENILCLCAGCHRWAHDNPLDFALWFNQAYPERYLSLKAKKRVIRKWTIEDYKNIIKELQNYA